MKTPISPAALLVVIIFGTFFCVSAQQSTDDLQKPLAEQTKNPTAALTATERTSAAAKTDSNEPALSSEAEKFYQSGLALSEKGSFADAIEAFKQSLRIRPNDAQTNFGLGIAYSKTKSYKDALESFKLASKSKPNWAEAHFQIGMMSYVVGKRNEAVDEYKLLLQIDMSLANVLYRIIKDDLPGIEQRATNAETKPTEPTTLPTAPKTTPTPNVNTNSETSTKESPLTEIYRVGVGDVLDIRVLNSASGRSTLFTVIAGGLIDMPIAGGPIQVAGLTVDEIQTRISTELKRRAVNDGTQVSVGVRQYSSHSVVVTGLVVSPGTKYLRREAVPLYVVLAESQLRNDAGRVVIMRSGASGQSLNLSDPASMNVTVLPGDVLSVSGRQEEFYYIAGRINYPGQKVFQPGITLLQAILAAGGTQRQNASVVEISREDSDSRLVTTRFSIKEIKAGKIPDPKLQPGDRIEVLR
ncbi:MAG: hypothetical protein C5B55_09030 [Blastocatellia bacterium]|nr:MAG: hypothetical protein C5B55_09030 [Blastocatellia bacterium]